MATPVTPYEEECAGWRVRRYAVLGSTMDECRARVLDGDGDRRAVLADCQRAGRGRRGRRWECPPGAGLLLTAALPMAAEEASGIGLLPGAAGLAAAGAVEEAAGMRVGLKWPNDLVVAERKLGGILIELAADRSGGRWALVGFGINLNQEPAGFPPEARDRAVSLQMLTGRRWSAGDLMPALLAGLDREVDRWRRDPEATLRRWSDLEVTRGRPVWIKMGEARRAATSLGIAPSGALRVRWEDGLIGEVEAGEVSVRARR